MGYSKQTVKTLNAFYSKAHKGLYTLRNPDKYVEPNIKEIIYRSALERSAFFWFDSSPYVLEWGSEIMAIQYYFNHNYHKYIPDVYAKIIDKDNKITKYMIEIKPSNKLKMPKKPKNMSKKFLVLCEEYARNKAKWKYAKNYCEKVNMEFMVLTEKTIGK